MTVAQTEKEIETLIADEEGEYEEKKETTQRYDYYRSTYDYFRRLSGYLTERRKDIEQVCNRNVIWIFFHFLVFKFFR